MMWSHTPARYRGGRFVKAGASYLALWVGVVVVAASINGGTSTNINDRLQVYLQGYYATTTAPLADLIVRYLNENPNGISGYTERYQRLIADAEA